MKFRKKPVVIEAARWDGFVGDGTDAAKSPWPPGWPTRQFIRHDDEAWGPVLVIDTLEGRMKADVGDWIIRGVKGEFYPCKPDIFAMTYEPAPDTGGGTFICPNCAHAFDASRPAFAPSPGTESGEGRCQECGGQPELYFTNHSKRCDSCGGTGSGEGLAGEYADEHPVVEDGGTGRSTEGDK